MPREREKNINKSRERRPDKEKEEEEGNRKTKNTSRRVPITFDKEPEVPLSDGSNYESRKQYEIIITERRKRKNGIKSRRKYYRVKVKLDFSQEDKINSARMLSCG